MAKPIVSVVMGSDSDLKTMEFAFSVLSDFGVPHEIRILSAHRTPQEAIQFARGAHARGLRVIIAGAGGAAHLGGVIAANTVLPVIGVPMGSGTLKGMDSLLSTVQMPKGIPVATVAIGNSGAANAALLAVEILAIGSSALRKRLERYRSKLRREVLAKDKFYKKR